VPLAAIGCSLRATDHRTIEVSMRVRHATIH
jgi:hypothetical protein